MGEKIEDVPEGLRGVKGLTFDVFGTVVNWRKTITETLISSAAAKISSSSRSNDLPPSIRLRVSQLKDEDWAKFAQEWRDTYKKFCHGFVAGESEWRDIDTHHHLSLIELLKSWGLEGLYTEDEVEELSLTWHFLEPWPDSSAGITKLGTRYITSTLSNGNQSLLADLNSTGKLGFKKLISAEDFKAYKPSEKVYTGAVRELEFKEGEVAMVAAHLGDLKAAKRNGMRTVYVERKGEEDWEKGGEEWKSAREWVDLWVSEEEEGFLEVARRFGL